MTKTQKLTAIARTVRSIRKNVLGWRATGETVALVPTMGALHDGHLSLVRHVQKKADRVVVSIFVNPTQFGKGEDLSTYPRDEKADRAKLSELGVDLIFAPSVEEMYGEGFATGVHVDGLTDVLCGASRPGHFDGVATVVTKLLLQAGTDLAIFGEKDFQQLVVIKRLVSDLNIPVKILGGSIVREKDGLALSSRNAYLSSSERRVAPLLFQTLKTVRNDLKDGQTAKAVLSRAAVVLEDAGFKVDYLELRDSISLQTLKRKGDGPARLFVAAFLGKTRLIDNIKI